MTEKHYKQVINFAEWYSGMDRIKVQKAYERYLTETNPPLSPAQSIEPISDEMQDIINCIAQFDSEDGYEILNYFNTIQTDCKKIIAALKGK